jgi:hypothetical protein
MPSASCSLTSSASFARPHTGSRPKWHEDDVWIAEVDASYELRDWLRLTGLPRAFILRAGTDGVSELKAYGAHEHQLSNHPTGGKAMWIGGRWVPPL